MLHIPYTCSAEPYAYDASAHTLTLTGLKTAGDCVGKIVSPLKVTSIVVTWDPTKDTLNVNAGIGTIALTKCA